MLRQYSKTVFGWQFWIWCYLLRSTGARCIWQCITRIARWESNLQMNGCKMCAQPSGHQLRRRRHPGTLYSTTSVLSRQTIWAGSTIGRLLGPGKQWGTQTLRIIIKHSLFHYSRNSWLPRTHSNQTAIIWQDWSGNCSSQKSWNSTLAGFVVKSGEMGTVAYIPCLLWKAQSAQCRAVPTLLVMVIKAR